MRAYAAWFAFCAALLAGYGYCLYATMASVIAAFPR
jgi:hypothetical protein